jgi:hypothetical protein
MRALAKRLIALEQRWPEEEPIDPALDEEIADLEDNLYEFVKAAWPAIDSSEFQPNWAIEALCEHLQAVTEGQISRLLVNFPPRCSKTLITSVCWPAWTWARRQTSYRSGPSVKFLCGSYGHTLSILNSNLSRRLILSPWFQERWSRRFQLRVDQNTVCKVIGPSHDGLRLLPFLPCVVPRLAPLRRGFFIGRPLFREQDRKRRVFRRTADFFRAFGVLLADRAEFAG